MGHAYGSGSPIVENEIKKVDEVIGDMLHQLFLFGMWQSTNIIFVADQVSFLPVSFNTNTCRS